MAFRKTDVTILNVVSKYIKVFLLIINMKCLVLVIFPKHFKKTHVNQILQKNEIIFKTGDNVCTILLPWHQFHGINIFQTHAFGVS